MSLSQMTARIKGFAPLPEPHRERRFAGGTHVLYDDQHEERMAEFVRDRARALLESLPKAQAASQADTALPDARSGGLGLPGSNGVEY